MFPQDVKIFHLVLFLPNLYRQVVKLFQQFVTNIVGDECMLLCKCVQCDRSRFEKKSM